jgi:tetratricopeptide (TPR) repeat protein
MERWWRQARRWRLAATVTASALVLLVVAAGVAGVAKVRLDRERMASLTSLRQMTRSSLESALRLRRAGDVIGMRQMLPQLEQAYEEARKRAPDLAELDYLLGRMQRALMDDAHALERQNLALRKDPAFAPALYERAVLLSRRYGREVNRVLGWSRPVGGRATRRPRRPDAPVVVDEGERRNPELTRMREEILRDLVALEHTAAKPGSGLNSAALRAARGIFAFHEGRGPEAMTELRAALSVDPDMEEAWETLAATEETYGSVDSADSVYTRALARDRGYVPLLIGRCRARISRDSKQAAGEADATAAIKLMPDATDAWLCRGMVRVFRAWGAFQTGGAALPILADAERDFARATQLDSGNWGALWGSASVHRYLAVVQMRQGIDVGIELQAALDDINRAEVLAPKEATLYALRGRVRLTEAAARAARGETPEPSIATALAAFDHAAPLAPEATDVREWRAEAYAMRAAWKSAHGQPADADLATAEAELDAVISPPRGSRNAMLARGAVRAALGLVAVARGGDPEKIWADAQVDLDRAIDRKREYSDGWLARAGLWLARATVRDRAAASAARVAARADLDQAIAIDRALPQAWIELGRLRLVERNKNAAAEAFAEAKRLNPMAREPAGFVDPPTGRR